MGANEFRQMIPLLHGHTRVQDLDALRAWYEAVEDALRPEIPLDLFALWIYAANGEPILIEPEALAQDNLQIPPATPIADQDALDTVEDRVRRAGYGSVLLRPIRHGKRDVGVFLLAAFRPHAFVGKAEAAALAAVEVMAPMLARATRHSGAIEEPERVAVLGAAVPPAQPAPPPTTRDPELLEALANAIGGASTPRDLMLALSFALQQALPHDAYELLISDTGGENCYRLGLHGHGTLWGDSELVLPKSQLDPGALFGDRTAVIIEDTSTGTAGALPVLVTVGGPEVPPRSVLALKLRVVDRLVGYLIIGNAGPGFYREEDLALLDHVGALLAPRIDALVLAWQNNALRVQLEILRHVPMHLARVAEILAGAVFLGEGSRMFAQQAAYLLPVNAIEFAVRLSDDARVAIVRPGGTTPLADLPQVPIEGSEVATVIRGETPYLLVTHDDAPEPGSTLVVPLRTGGRILGAMALTATGSSAFGRTDLALAQQLADLAAPHLDLVRRIPGPTVPFATGWKRPTYRPERERQE